MRNIRLSFAGALLALPLAAFAWGAQGHRITGLVAEGLLTADARTGLVALMGKVDLAAASVLLDQQKEQFEKTMPGSRRWHYDDKPVCEPAAKPASYCSNGNCASAQIKAQYLRLVNEHATKAEKAFAVNALVHLVGDIHQPLHASDHDDAGGNGIAVAFTLPGSSAPRRNNLHSAWDSDFVRAALKSSDERKIARELLQALSSEQRKAWQRGSAPTWMAESYKLSRRLSYGGLPGFNLADNNCPSEDDGEEPVTLSKAYVDEAIDTVPQLLTQAGVRIALLLNRAFAK
ncbi:MAG: S1/P1 nuclease [Rubrivivax sp.]